MKTIQDYMTDPRLLNDPCMKGALEPVVRIHAIRLKIEDEYSGMTEEEEIKARNEKGRAFLARYGLSDRLVNLSGQGKLHPRATVEA